MAENAPGTQGSTAKGLFRTRVVANVPLCREHHRLTLEATGFPDASPGQFLQIRCAAPDEPLGAGPVLIRRPFSIGGLERSGVVSRLSILWRVLGQGTRWMARLNPGDEVEVLGPLGHPFRIDPDRPLAWLVGGGIGLPPILWMAEFVHRTGKQAVAFCGARTADLLPLQLLASFDRAGCQPQQGVAEFDRWGIPTLVTTDDGSLGAAGQIPEHFAAYLDAHAAQRDRAVVYTCGPEPMMRAVAEACDKRGVLCQVSMERMMACGMGTCQSCVTRIRDDADPEGWSYRLCCTDGPVFLSRDILWDQVPLKDEPGGRSE